MIIPKRLSKDVRSTAVAVIAALGAALPSTGAAAADLIVRYDQSQLLRLPRPVSEVIIGNPSIADVTVQGGNLLVVTGKTFGITNIIALDADRNVIQDQRVIVDQDDRRTVVVYRGPQRHTYTCAPTCSPALVIGDDAQYFGEVTKAMQAKTNASQSTNQPAAE
ncbi:MAG TPA: pilus assembly protein N-terminal domain-containing protein [Hyphomicrobium sp.]|nr:pilus assembly protein N-terminal domain-containing protein [Hyphomicrobium sp.]